MIERSFAWSADLSVYLVGVAVALALIGLGLIAWELFRARRSTWLVASTGTLATLLLLAAVLRPVRVRARVTRVGPRVVVLVDRSLSMALQGDDGTRWQTARKALRTVQDAARDARFTVRGFGEGKGSEVSISAADSSPDHARSDLVSALESLSGASEEMPSAIVVISDGRLDRPGAASTGDALARELGSWQVPVHTIAVAHREPIDASVRAVDAAGATVAHQQFALRIAVSCTGGLRCDGVPVSVRELVESGPPVQLASGVATMVDGTGTVELPVTLDRAGKRVVEIAITAPDGDEIPDNDRRYLTFDVTRDRVRVLHIAGRPTYDVRALRMWLKSDASLDIVAFFILRSRNDDVNASTDELALIQFPVDELFSEHLSSFDAVVLQDFDAEPYGLSPYLANLARYVERGGGLIMVGGQSAFSSGGYAGTPLEQVLPVALVGAAATEIVDNRPFVPSYSVAGREAPVLSPLRGLLGDDLPSMNGTNVVGDAHPGTVVLWEHPTRRTASGAPMPVLAVGEKGNGRSVALSIDDAHHLAFSEASVRTAGRAFGSLWDGLLGWLMRDPRYEPARVDVVGGCRADSPVRLAIRSAHGVSGDAELTVTPLGTGQGPRRVQANAAQGSKSFELELPALEPGGYAATIKLGSGPSTRQDFACERGGDEWADPRPDPARLESIAEATGGRSMASGNAAELRFPKATEIASERQTMPVLPPWLWTVAASIALGVHWVARRKVGLY